MRSSPVQVCSPCQMLRFKCEQNSPASVSLQGQCHKHTESPSRAGGMLGLCLQQQQEHQAPLSVAAHVTAKFTLIFCLFRAKDEAQDFGDDCILPTGKSLTDLSVLTSYPLELSAQKSPVHNILLLCFVCFWKNEISRTKEGLLRKGVSYGFYGLRFRITVGICWDLVKDTLLYRSSEAHRNMTSLPASPAAAWNRSVPS